MPGYDRRLLIAFSASICSAAYVCDTIAYVCDTITLLSHRVRCYHRRTRPCLCHAAYPYVGSAGNDPYVARAISGLFWVMPMERSMTKKERRLDEVRGDRQVPLEPHSCNGDLENLG